MEIEKVIKSILDCLSPDLLKPSYREENKKNPTFGHCYVASEVLFHLIEADIPGRFSPWIGKDDQGINHWWLVDNEDGSIVDPTADQYISQGKIPPYEHGRKFSFLTKNPSRRAKIVMERINLGRAALPTLRNCSGRMRGGFRESGTAARSGGSTRSKPPKFAFRP
jgi:hypothetical protein